ncbi:hypothetical protein HG530_009657 [Fusarium avenaceum]|nr:hypothetical protein HG530_009657 [Fusarium avenaceum]
MGTFAGRQHLVVRLTVEDAQNGKEEVNDVEVQADGSGDLFLDVVMTKDKLGVDQDVATENESGKATIDEFAGGTIREEHGHEAEDDKTPKGTEEIRHP